MIGPELVLPQLEERPDKVRTWLVSPAMDGERFRIVDCSVERATLNDIKVALEHDRIRSAWFLNHHVADRYPSILRGFDYLLATGRRPLVVNFSLGPRVRRARPDLNGPCHAIIEAATKAGLIVIVAHGNDGAADGSQDGHINPWAAPPSAIGVGACDAGGTSILPLSSRGAADRPATWPDLVAPGLSALNPQKVGTSFAVPHVAGAANQILHFLEGYARDAKPGRALHLRIPQETVVAGLALGPRLAGWRLPWDEDGSAVFEYHPTPSHALVRQLLRDFTRPLPGVGPHVAGAGVLDSNRLFRDLGTYGRAEAKIMAIKVE